MKCRYCASLLELVLVDLGSLPLSNVFLSEAKMRQMESWVPLRVSVCERCWLVQTDDWIDPSELFGKDYPYFSGFSSSWVKHCERHAEEMVNRFSLDSQSHVVEVATNDGTLLSCFYARGIPSLGVEPTTLAAELARSKGLEVLESFFGRQLATELCAKGRQADLMLANNVLAHVPDMNDFVSGFTLLLKPQGVVVFEFPHVLRLIQEKQFDTIYHEHFSYLSFVAVYQILSENGLTVFDVEQISTHGGSLRVYAQRHDGTQLLTGRVEAMLAYERQEGITSSACYAGYQAQVNGVKHDLLSFLLEAKRQGKKVGAYGAAAKGNTLLNYSGVRPDLLPYVVDRNPAKQGRFMPGSRIPIVLEAHLQQDRPDYVLILPWNLRDELVDQLAYIRAWGGRFVTAIPKLQIE